MRKSERLRLVELELIRLRIELDLVHQLVQTLLEINGAKDLDAGKWYQKPKRPDIPNN